MRSAPPAGASMDISNYNWNSPSGKIILSCSLRLLDHPLLKTRLIQEIYATTLVRDMMFFLFVRNF
jgi:hypothetical protein